MTAKDFSCKPSAWVQGERVEQRTFPQAVRRGRKRILDPGSKACFAMQSQFARVQPQLSLLWPNRPSAPSPNHFWAAANGGVTNGGLRGVWPPFLEIGRNRPKSPFFCRFRPFPEGAKSTWEIQGYLRKKAFFLRYPWISLNPHLLNPHLRPLLTTFGSFLFSTPLPGALFCKT